MLSREEKGKKYKLQRKKNDRILSKSKLGREEDNVPAPIASFIQPDKARDRDKLPELNDDKERGKDENWEKICGFRRRMNRDLKRIDTERIKETARNTALVDFKLWIYLFGILRNGKYRTLKPFLLPWQTYQVYHTLFSPEYRFALRTLLNTALKVAITD